MVLSPQQAGRNRELSDPEKLQFRRACEIVDDKLKKAYDVNPAALSVSIDVSDLKLTGLLEAKLRLAYENVGWSIKGESHRNESYLTFTPKSEGSKKY